VQDLRVATVRAICALDSALLEVRGEVVVRAGRRLSDQANHPDPMLELGAASMRVHGRQGPEEWEEVAGMTLNQDRVTVLVPVEDRDPGPDPRLVEASTASDVRVKLVCAAAQVTGFIKVPKQMTMASFMHSSRARFLAVTGCRVLGAPGAPPPGELEGAHAFCMVNRDHVIACTEARPSSSP
jgi:hypothetical protein